jgi:hypothetical protein
MLKASARSRRNERSNPLVREEREMGPVLADAFLEKELARRSVFHQLVSILPISSIRFENLDLFLRRPSDGELTAESPWMGRDRRVHATPSPGGR